MEHVAQELGVPSVHLAALQRELSPRADVRAIAELRRILRAGPVDILHTHTAKAGATGRIAASLPGRGRPRAVVHTYHGHVLSGYFDSRRERAFRGIERLLAHRTDALIAVSDEVRDDLVRMGVAPAGKFVVIPYGFDLDSRVDRSAATRKRMRAEAEATDDVFVVGWAGRLTAIKRPLDLIRVIEKVDGALLVLVGDGEDRGATEALARELGVADRVLFLGYRRDLPSWYVAFDAFLLTSANEGAPVVAIESLAAGVPVVATNAGGTRTVVDDGETGLLTAIGDVEALAAALDRLRRDSAWRAELGERGAVRVRERFSIDRMVDDVDRLYARVLA
jgi:glycosyltransferase involved in cell wall biosynthesis